MAEQQEEQSLNDSILDLFLLALIFDGFIVNGIRKELLATLSENNYEIERFVQKELKIFENFSNIKAGFTTFGKQADKLTEKMQQLALIRSQQWKSAQKFWNEQLQNYLDYKNVLSGKILNANNPFIRKIHVLSETDKSVIQTRTVIMGKTLKEWQNLIKSNDIKRIQTFIRNQLVQNQSTIKISEELFATKTGIQAKLQNEIQTISRTSFAAYSDRVIEGILQRHAAREIAAGRKSFYKELYVAVLDSRTTDICRSLDGSVFLPGQGSFPPLHFNCRSKRIPFLAIQPKDLKGKQRLLKIQTQDWDIAQRIGGTPKIPTLEKWINGQTEDMQINLMGKRDFELYKKGKLSFQDFLKNKKRTLKVSPEDIGPMRKAIDEIGLFKEYD